ncbi:MAG: NAD(+) synthase [Firmicutes bacterium]|nr:NAD(+) synthase [Bacillota bacterium]MCL5038581.1 NAD(+) synthase [Bacillota bacterium]
MEMGQLVDALVNWLRNSVEESGARGLVVGLSGGVDSAVVGALARRACPDNTLALIMPCQSSPEDAADARLVAETFGLNYRIVSLDRVYEALLASFLPGGGEGKPSAPGDLTRLAMANLKPRLRMLTIYFHANLYNYLVAGTGNRSELTVGYFTKYGDGGVDLLPLGHLVKGEVRALAQYLGVPERIITKPPTAGLWAGQTDEGEMGLTYEELDRYILTGEADPAVRERIESLNRRSEHKRHLPAVPNFH